MADESGREVPPQRLAAVIGSPVAHSLSPAIHRAAFASAGRDWSYVAFDVEPGAAGAALSSMRTLGIAGLSVTMPHKEEMARLVDRLDPSASALNSVNTISWDGDELVGSSTDGGGFVASLVDAGISVAGSSVVVLGAGAAARSVIDAIGRSQPAEIRIVNRSADKAAAAAELSTLARIGSVSEVSSADIVVNATSVGMGVDPADASADDFACDPDLLGAGQVAADLVYHPLETAWLRAAANRGARCIDGLGMLVHQAALQQRIWLGADAVIDTVAMRSAAEAELRRRSLTEC